MHQLRGDDAWLILHFDPAIFHVVYSLALMDRRKIPGMKQQTPAGFDVQGHRGARGLVPENTLKGFLLALELGVTTLEMDVVVSRDRQLVLSHDPWFSSDFSADPSGNRISPAAQFRHRIYRMDYETVRSYDCGLANARFPRQAPEVSRKPRLGDVLEAVEEFTGELGRDPVFYNIETKTTPAGDKILHPAPEEFVALLLDVVGRHGLLQRTTIQSFDPRTLREVRRRSLPVQTSLLIARGDHLGVAADLTILGFVPEIYSPDFRLVNRKLVRQVHARGMRLLPWTVNDPAEMVRMRELGADGVITDYPDVALEALQPIDTSSLSGMRG